MNIRSLNSNHRALCQFLQLLSIQFDVIVLSEIWSYNLEFFHNILPGYDFYYNLPVGSNIGGIGMFIHSGINHYHLSEYKLTSSDDRIEDIWFEICKN